MRVGVPCADSLRRRIWSAPCCRALRTWCARPADHGPSSDRREGASMPLVPQEIPKIGLVMEAVTILRWLKNVGDPDHGRRAAARGGKREVGRRDRGGCQRSAPRGSGRSRRSGAVGDRVAWIDVRAAASAASTGVGGDTQRPTAVTSEPAAGARPGADRPATASCRRAAGIDRTHPSSPVARKLAAERGVDLGAVRRHGTGRTHPTATTCDRAAGDIGPGAPRPRCRASVVRHAQGAGALHDIEQAAVPQFDVAPRSI